jgi:hypothetical protein
VQGKSLIITTLRVRIHIINCQDSNRLWARVHFPAGTKDFSLLCSTHSGSESHPAFYPMVTRGSLIGVKQPGHKADHSPLSIVKVKNGGAKTRFLNISMVLN